VLTNAMLGLEGLVPTSLSPAARNQLIYWACVLQRLHQPLIFGWVQVKVQNGQKTKPPNKCVLLVRSSKGALASFDTPLSFFPQSLCSMSNHACRAVALPSTVPGLGSQCIRLPAGDADSCESLQLRWLAKGPSGCLDARHRSMVQRFFHIGHTP